MKEVSYKLQGVTTAFDHWRYMCLSEEWTMSTAVSVLQESLSSLWLVGQVGMSRTSHTDLPLQDCVTTWQYWTEKTKRRSPVCPCAWKGSPACLSREPGSRKLRSQSSSVPGGGYITFWWPVLWFILHGAWCALYFKKKAWIFPILVPPPILILFIFHLN